MHIIDKTNHCILITSMPPNLRRIFFFLKPMLWKILLIHFLEDDFNEIVPQKPVKYFKYNFLHIFVIVAFHLYTSYFILGPLKYFKMYHKSVYPRAYDVQWLYIYHSTCRTPLILTMNNNISIRKIQKKILISRIFLSFVNKVKNNHILFIYIE